MPIVRIIKIDHIRYTRISFPILLFVQLFKVQF